MRTKLLEENKDISNVEISKKSAQMWQNNKEDK